MNRARVSIAEIGIDRIGPGSGGRKERLLKIKRPTVSAKGSTPAAEAPAAPQSNATVPGPKKKARPDKPATPANIDATASYGVDPTEEMERARLAAKRMAKTAAKFKANAEQKARAAAQAEAAARAQASGKGGGAGQTMPAVVRDQGRTDLVPQPEPQVPDTPASQDQAPQDEAQVTVNTTPAAQSHFRFRHGLLLLSFLVIVVIPTAISGWYLWTRAADQYASNSGFSVRTEESAPSVASFLGGLSLGGTNTPDADIIFEFITSQDLVERVNARLDLAEIWSKADPKIDPYFSFHAPGTIEDLLSHWRRKVTVSYDSGNGLVEMQVLAFDPQDAQDVATAILEESTKLINQLSASARADAIGYAQGDLDQALEQLKTARRTVTEFRNRNQIVDPELDIQSQASILSSLQTQLADSLIELELLGDTVRANDPRVVRIERRIRAIEARIAEERRKFGIAGNVSDQEAYANLVGEFESLMIERQFAEESYTAARIAFDTAKAEAARQSRYLAVHVRPTLAQKSQFPERQTLLGFVALFAFLFWAILSLIAYSLRDRR